MGLKEFWALLGQVAYLQQELGWFKNLDYVIQVQEGMSWVVAKRRWVVSGITLEDEVSFMLNGQIYLSGTDLLVCYGWYDNPDDLESNPKVGAWWTTQMYEAEIGETYQAQLLSPARQN